MHDVVTVILDPVPAWKNAPPLVVAVLLWMRVPLKLTAPPPSTAIAPPLRAALLLVNIPLVAVAVDPAPLTYTPPPSRAAVLLLNVVVPLIVSVEATDQSGSFVPVLLTEKPPPFPNGAVVLVDWLPLTVTSFIVTFAPTVAPPPPPPATPVLPLIVVPVIVTVGAPVS